MMAVGIFMLALTLFVALLFNPTGNWKVFWGWVMIIGAALVLASICTMLWRWFP